MLNFGQQLALQSILTVPLTPWGIGLAEGLFVGFLGEAFFNLAIANMTALVWRLLTFYPILILGTTIFPIWIKRIINDRSDKIEISNKFAQQ